MYKVDVARLARTGGRWSTSAAAGYIEGVVLIFPASRAMHCAVRC